VGERSSYPAGTFCWVDLGTDDAEDATRFYGELFGWTAREVGGEGVSYVMLERDGREVAAVYPKQAPEAPTTWLSYIAVPDVERAVRRAGEGGGSALGEPFDAGPHGRGAVIADPTGAVVGLWEAGEHPGARLVNVPGALTWNELNTGDVEAAAAFYRDAFGWTVDPVPGAEPAYWSVQVDGRKNGGMRPLDPEAPGPYWLVYFASGDAEETAGRVEQLGGRVLISPTPVPAGRFAVFADPQGGVFAVVDGDFDP
jgi:predicted enzyme related to lactoylglutathione lyase